MIFIFFKLFNQKPVKIFFHCYNELEAFLSANENDLEWWEYSKETDIQELLSNSDVQAMMNREMNETFDNSIF